jgi:hypothetical protein
MSQIETIAEDLSAGLACLAHMPQAVAPDPEWPSVLDALQRALEDVRDGRVATNIAVTDGDLATLQRVRELLASGQHVGAAALAGQLYELLTGSRAGALEQSATFTPAGGGSPSAVTLRISDVRREGEQWGARVEIVGLGPTQRERVYADGWPQVIERAAQWLAELCAAQTGTFAPPLVAPGRRS